MKDCGRRRETTMETASLLSQVWLRLTSRAKVLTSTTKERGTKGNKEASISLSAARNVKFDVLCAPSSWTCQVQSKVWVSRT